MNMIPQDLLHKTHAPTHKEMPSRSTPKKPYPSTHSNQAESSSRFALDHESLQEALAEAMQEELKKARDHEMSEASDGFFSEEDSSKEEIGCCAAPAMVPLACAENTTSTTLVAPSTISEVSSLFETMIGTIHTMIDKGKAETTVTLSNPNSIFFGGKIVIQEFSTAPKAFNVQIIASSQAIALCQQHTGDLMRFFDKHADRFTIHQIDTLLQTDRQPLVQKVESLSEEQNEDT